ncbi:MAG: GNAT family N-acetyltransferase [Candidatus Heimdallarchaeota archaeon]|nr:GNAT family N-acetyltransferase [Candidatus Heimdallarchaeota archaeon]
MEIRWIDPESTFELRSQILNKNKASRPGDENALHLGTYIDDKLIAIASFFAQDETECFQDGYWRIRGMAVQDLYQRRGIGKKMVEFFINSKPDIKYLWCNARQGAEGFYLTLGFESSGLIERMPGVKVHRMFKYFYRH